jgi:hypothetical protein
MARDRRKTGANVTSFATIRSEPADGGRQPGRQAIIAKSRTTVQTASGAASGYKSHTSRVLTGSYRHASGLVTLIEDVTEMTASG